MVEAPVRMSLPRAERGWVDLRNPDRSEKTLYGQKTK